MIAALMMTSKNRARADSFHLSTASAMHSAYHFERCRFNSCPTNDLTEFAHLAFPNLSEVHASLSARAALDQAHEQTECITLTQLQTAPQAKNGNQNVNLSKLNEWICINLGGRKWEVRARTLFKKQPSQSETRIGRILKEIVENDAKFEEIIDRSTGEWRFERPQKELDIISEYHLTGQVHCPQGMCVERLAQILIYWCIPLSAVPMCCNSNAGSDHPKDSTATHLTESTTHKHSHRLTSAQTESSIFEYEPRSNQKQRPNGDMPNGHRTFSSLESQSDENLSSDEATKQKTRYQRLQHQLWQLFEEPQSSHAAKAISVISMLFIMASVAGLLLSSMDTYQIPCQFELSPLFNNITSIRVHDTQCQEDPMPVFALQVLEYFSVGWFTLEFCARLFGCPDKWDFLKQPLNEVDAATIVPFYAELCLPLVGVEADSLRRVKAAMLVIRILRVLRVARIFKLARYSKGLQSVGRTFKTSAKELSMLLMMMATAVVFFSTTLYFVERDSPHTQFTSIPAACWWCVVTMTTVGYGDMVPTTVGGKIVATLTSVCGIIVLAFPISTIVENFAQVQEQDQAAANAEFMASHNQNNPNMSKVSTVSQPLVQHRRRFGGRFGGGRRRTQASLSSIT